MQKNKEGSFLRIIFITLAGILVAIIPIRCYQYIRVLEPGTGFYNGFEWSRVVMYVLLATAAVFFLIASFVGRKKIEYSREKFKSLGVAVASFMFALTLVIDAVSQYKTVFETVSDSALMYGTESIQYLKTGLASRGLEGFTAIVSAVFFILFGYGHISGKSNASDSKLLALFPTVWCIFRLMHRFMHTINFLNVSDLLYELFMCVFLMAFFMVFAQINSKVGSDGIDWKLTGYGMPAAMFCMLCFLPRFIMLLTGKSSLLCTQSPIEWCDLGAAVFIIALLLSRIGLKTGTSEPAAETTENTES